MKKMKDNKGFTLVELLAVIVVLAIVMGLAVVGITSVLDSTRKSAFAADAKTFIAATRSLVNSDQANAMLGVSTLYSPSCTTDETVYIPLASIPLDGGKAWANQKSPYGVSYNYGTASGKLLSAPDSSFIIVKSTVTDGNCVLSYGIYLTDSVMMIKGGNGGAASGNTAMKDKDGNDTKAMAEEYIEAANVVKKS